MPALAYGNGDTCTDIEFDSFEKRNNKKQMYFVSTRKAYICEEQNRTKVNK